MLALRLRTQPVLADKGKDEVTEDPSLHLKPVTSDVSLESGPICRL